ncbi:hypothetical protein BDZ97DRAFT_1594301, partial [Flammula alnicola]
VPVELALRVAFHYRIIESANHAGSSFLVRSDNQGVVAVVNKGRSRSRNTIRILKEIYKLLAKNQLSLHSEYVASRDNITDALSRGDIPHLESR